MMLDVHNPSQFTELYKLVTFTAECYATVSNGKYLTAYIKRHDENFESELKKYAGNLSACKKNDNSYNKIVKELEEFLENKIKDNTLTNRVFQLSKLLQFALQAQKKISSQLINESIESLRTFRREVQEQEDSLKFIFKPATYLEDFIYIADSIETQFSEQLPAKEQLQQVNTQLDLTIQDETKLNKFITNQLSKSESSPEKESDIVNLLAKSNLAAQRIKQVEDRKTKLETELASLTNEKEQMKREITMSEQSTNFLQRTLNSTIKENKKLKKQLESHQEDYKTKIIFTKSQFKRIIKTSEELELAFNLVQLKITIEKIYQQFEKSNNRDMGQNRNFLAYYTYFSKLLPCLTETKARNEYLNNDNKEIKEANLAANKALCKVILEKVLVTAEQGAKDLAILTASMPNLIRLEQAPEKTKQAYYDAIEENAQRLKNETGIANEFYKLAFHIENDEFHRVVRDWGDIIIDNNEVIAELAYEALGLEVKPANSLSL